MLRNGELYKDPGNDYFTRQNPDHVTKRPIRQLEALGDNVTIEPRTAPV
jgi:transposase